MPDLVIEVLSPATRANDLGAKRDVYLAAGVRELWLADPEAHSLTLVDDDGERETASRGDHVTSPALHGFTLDVATIFGA